MEEIAGPRVSALIVARNQIADLRRCLAALEASSARPVLEAVVVDNGSRDGSQELDSDFPAVHFLRLPKNFGFTKAANIGIRTAKGEFILFLPAAATVEPDAVQKLMDTLDASPEAGAACPRVDEDRPLPDADILRTTWATGGIPAARNVRYDNGPAVVVYPLGSPLLIRRTSLAGMNYLDRGFGEYWWDAEVCRQLQSAGKIILALPDARMKMHSPALCPPPDAVASADLALGGARFLSKSRGAGAGLRFRMWAIFHVLGQLVTFRRPGYNARRLVALVSGQKVDGNQPNA